MNNLSKETIEIINKKAAYYSGYDENEDHTPISKGKYYGYCAGATEWAAKTQDYSNLLSEMRDCLSAVLMINDVRPLQDSELIEDIKNTVAKYKEVSNER